MKKASISIAKGKGSLAHNNRDFICENVDQSRTKDNITYKKETLEQAYEKCFGKAVEEYNSKQKRKDRKISGAKGYMEQIKNSGNGEKLFYENIVQVGNMFDSRVGTAQGEVCREVLDDYMADFQKRNPNLYVFNAVLHMDEQTPHLHIDYIPLAHGYKQGLQVRNSLDKALKEQGVDGKSNKYENRTIAWQRAEKDHIEVIMKEYKLERAKETSLKEEHKPIEYYKKVARDVHNQVREMPKQIEYQEPKFGKKDRVLVEKKDLLQLEKRAKLSLVHEKATKVLVEDVKDNVKATYQHNTATRRTADGLLEKARKEQQKAEEELEQARKWKAKYIGLYNSQEQLNNSYKQLYNAYEQQKTTIEKLQSERTSLKAQIATERQSAEERLQNTVEPLQRQIEGLKRDKVDLKERLEGMCLSLVNVVKAFGMLKFDEKEGYKVKLNDKQSKLFTAIENYCVKWLREEKMNDMVADIQKNIGISKGISDKIKELNQTQSRGR